MKSLLDRLRREHRRRFVHDQQTRVLQQAAHDLHALALAHRQTVHVALRIDIEPVIRRYLADALAERLQVEFIVEGERDVFADRQRIEQRKMLEHHADAELSRRRRTADLDRLAVPTESRPRRDAPRRR